MIEVSFSIMTAQCRLYHRMLGVFSEVAQKMKATCMPNIFMRWENDHYVPVSAVLGTPDRLDATVPPDRPLLAVKYILTTSHQQDRCRGRMETS